MPPLRKEEKRKKKEKKRKKGRVWCEGKLFL
jgi:hypothetical protein